jgi:SNF2 family DNA or RNA helicase
VKEMHETYVEFTPDERNMYKAVEARARIDINRYLREGDGMKNYSNILAMLVRLRQVCSSIMFSNSSFVFIRISFWNMYKIHGLLRIS